MIHLIALALYVQTNILTLLVAVIVAFIIGFLWYGPLFGAKWMHYNNIPEPKKGEVTFSMMLPGILASILMAFVQATVIGRTFEIVTMNTIGQAYAIALIFWIPFIALPIINSYTWSDKCIGHMCLDAFYNLVTLLAIATVLYLSI